MRRGWTLGFAAVVTTVGACSTSHDDADAGVDAWSVLDAGVDAVAFGDAAVDAAADACTTDPSLSCRCRPWPTTTVDPIVMDGYVSGSLTSAPAQPIRGATVRMRRTDTDAVIAETTTDLRGHYVLDVPTGGVPLVGAYREIAAPGYVTSIGCSDAPIVAESFASGRTIILSSPTNDDAFYTRLGLARDPTKGTVWMQMFACSSPTPSGFDEQCEAAETTRYLADVTAGTYTATVPLGWVGIAVAANVAPGNQLVSYFRGADVWGRVSCPVRVGATTNVFLAATPY